MAEETPSSDDMTPAGDDSAGTDATEPSGQGSSGGSFEAPRLGSLDMPAWNTGELIDAPRFTSRNWFALLGPGLIMGGSAIGGGEWLLGPKVTGVYGGGLLWVATLSILGQVLYNIEISRYTLYTGEPIFTGKFRMMPGPRFWVVAYLLFDFGSIFPYLAANAATPVATLILGGQVPQPDKLVFYKLLSHNSDWYLMKGLAYAIFLGALVPLLFGGKIYRSLKAIMTFKLIVVFGFLLFLAFGYSKLSTWGEITTGFVSFGKVPVLRAEDTNGNNVLDPGEDWDGDGHLDVVEPQIDSNQDGEFDSFEDLDGDGYRDGRNVDSIWSMLGGSSSFKDIDFTMVGLIAALAAIAGSGGLSNTPTSNYTRDQGWGMGHHVGAIPSTFGGHDIELSHTGTVFEVTEEYLAASGLAIDRPSARRYTASIPSMKGVEVVYQRAADITSKVDSGNADLGMVGYDNFAETRLEGGDTILIAPDLGYGKCELVVAVPDAWMDVDSMSDLADLSVDARVHLKHHYQQEASLLAAAPGRVNLIGEHTDQVLGELLALSPERLQQLRADGVIR